MEAELNSPMVTMRPGESYAFDTEWFPTRATSAFTSVNAAGLVSSPVTLTKTSGGVSLTGTFGVFFPGQVQAYFLDANGTDIGQKHIANADPAELLQVNAQLELPARTATISLHLIDSSGIDRGILAEVNATFASGGAS